MIEYLPAIATVALIDFLAIASPGPDFVMAVRNSLTYSRRTGIWTAVGFALGIVVHIAYCLAGLAFLISQSILLFNVFKFLGAAYLVYIGIKSIRARGSHIEINAEKKSDISPFQAIKIGFITNVLNPKATLFFLSLFTVVIDPSTPATIIGIMSAMMIINTFIWFSLVAIFFTQKPIQRIFQKFESAFNKTLGGLLIALGVKVALAEK